MFHEHLKTLRKQKGWSQEELAGKLHVTRQTISKWEQGTSVPDAQLLLQLSELFELGVEELLQKKTTKTMNFEELTQEVRQLKEEIQAKEKRKGNLWKLLKYCLIALLVLTLIYVIISILSFQLYQKAETTMEMVEAIE